MTGKSGHDDGEWEFDHRWASEAAHKEPSARARMLAARWKENPPEPVPFRAEPDYRRPRRRSSWVSTSIVISCVSILILLIGYVNFRAAH